jgi:decaprenyl-phosphate phosphoribosyltransferase
VLSALLRAARPKQWLKNILVFAAPGAAGVLDQGHELALTVLTFVAFCFAASGTYIWNDLLDVEADRRHPKKSKRPIAAGDLSVGAAKVAGVVFPVISLVLASFTGRWQTVAVIGTYLVITISYTLWLKHVAVVDLVTIAAGFVLRAAAGAVAVDVPMSRWFVLCITFGSLFIVIGKRYAELNELGDAAGTRSTLEVYSVGYLRILLAVSLAGVLISYCVWALDTSELAQSNWPLY